MVRKLASLMLGLGCLVLVSVPAIADGNESDPWDPPVANPDLVEDVVIDILQIAWSSIWSVIR